MEKLDGGSISHRDTDSLRSTNEKERRQDHKLRSAVQSIKGLLFDIDLEQSIYNTVLNQLLELTGSHLGAALAADDENATPLNISTKVLVHRDRSGYVNLAREINHAPLLSFIHDCVYSRRTIFFNSDIPDDLFAAFEDITPELKNILIVPIFSADKLSAIYLLANCPGGYHASLSARLQPIVAASECVVRTSIDIEPTMPELRCHLTEDRYLHNLMSASPSALMIVDGNDQVISFNPAAEQLFGVEQSDNLGQAVTRFLPEYHYLFAWPDSTSSWMHSVEINPVSQLRENISAVARDGRHFYVNVTLFRNRRGNERYTTLLLDAPSSDMEHRDKQLSQKFDALASLTPAGIIELNTQLQCTYANRHWFDMCEHTQESYKQAPWYSAIHPTDLHETLDAIRDAIDSENNLHRELRLLSQMGKVRWVEINARPIYNDSEDCSGLLASINDITEQRQVKERLRQVAELDPLTGLANRVLFQDRVQQMLVATERNAKMVAVMCIDLDGFKDINDTLGHDAGDTLLKHVARRLVNALRNEDTVARFSSDEFTVLLRHVHAGEYVPMVADKLIRTLSAPYMLNANEVFMTASIGIAVGNAKSGDAKKLIKQADIALDKAKSEGRNRFHYFTPEMDQQAHARLQLVHHIHRALGNDELSVEYQPQANTHNGALTGFEALLRWNHPEMGSVPPIKFIPLMEESNVIVSVGRWVLSKACHQLQLWRENGLVRHNITMSVNVSARQLNHTDLAKEVSQALLDSGLPAENLILEITESVLISKAKRASKQISELKTLGVKFALDDFGTGYSSLSYLQQFPIDHIKIDQSFVRDVMRDEQDANIAKAIIALGHSLGMSVTAEGVADANTLDFLRNEGCDNYQGFQLSASQVPSKLVKALKMQRRVVPMRK